MQSITVIVGTPAKSHGAPQQTSLLWQLHAWPRQIDTAGVGAVSPLPHEPPSHSSRPVAPEGLPPALAAATPLAGRTGAVAGGAGAGVRRENSLFWARPGGSRPDRLGQSDVVVVATEHPSGPPPAHGGSLGWPAGLPGGAQLAMPQGAQQDAPFLSARTWQDESDTTSIRSAGWEQVKLLARARPDQVPLLPLPLPGRSSESDGDYLQDAPLEALWNPRSQGRQEPGYDSRGRCGFSTPILVTVVLLNMLVVCCLAFTVLDGRLTSRISHGVRGDQAGRFVSETPRQSSQLDGSGGPLDMVATSKKRTPEVMQQADSPTKKSESSVELDEFPEHVALRTVGEEDNSRRRIRQQIPGEKSRDGQ